MIVQRTWATNPLIPDPHPTRYSSPSYANPHPLLTRSLTAASHPSSLPPTAHFMHTSLPAPWGDAAQAEKEALRQILHSDAKMDALLRQLRQLLGYYNASDGEPPDLHALSAQVDAVSGDWWSRNLTVAGGLMI